MKTSYSRWKLGSRGLMHLTLIGSLLLMLLPADGWLSQLQPYWLALVLIYWVMEEPRHAGLLLAFFYGLLLDVLHGSLLGKHGLSLLVISYLVGKYSHQFRMTSFWQLALIVGSLLFNDWLIRALVDWLAFGQQPRWRQMLPIAVAIFLWPWLKLLLDHLHTRTRR